MADLCGSDTAGTSSSDCRPQSYHLPASLIAATHKPRALKYFTRGLTSQIYTFSPDNWDSDDLVARQQLQAQLENSGVYPQAQLIVKCVDLEDQPRPHDVLREIDILKSIRDSSDRRKELIVPLLHEEQEVPDDFTTIQRLYFPCYASDLTTFLAADASCSASGFALLSQDTRLLVTQRLAHQLYSALDFLHTNGIYHRDIKPGNILLTDTPSQDTPTSFSIKICDFGTAFRKMPQKERPSTCSTSTNPYTPPELLFSPEGGYDGRAVDVWEAACVIAEVLGEVQCDPEDDDYDDDDDEGSYEDFTGPSVDDPDTEMQRQLDEHCLWPTRPGEVDDVPTSNRSSFTQAPTNKRYSRRTLFNGRHSDIGLAADIFVLLGLPQGDRDDLWPEAVHFHPPLSRLPFPPNPPPSMPQALQDRLPCLARVLRTSEDDAASTEARRCAQAVQDVLIGSLKLSAQTRWSAQDILNRLEAPSELAAD